jgi:peptidyl-tRNA hydrolase
MGRGKIAAHVARAAVAAGLASFGEAELDVGLRDGPLKVVVKSGLPGQLLPFSLPRNAVTMPKTAPAKPKSVPVEVVR